MRRRLNCIALHFAVRRDLRTPHHVLYSHTGLLNRWLLCFCLLSLRQFLLAHSQSVVVARLAPCFVSVSCRFTASSQLASLAFLHLENLRHCPRSVVLPSRVDNNVSYHVYCQTSITNVTEHLATESASMRALKSIVKSTRIAGRGDLSPEIRSLTALSE